MAGENFIALESTSQEIKTAVEGVKTDVAGVKTDTAQILTKLVDGEAVHITKIHCYKRDIYTRAPSPGGYSFYILVNDVQKADIKYNPDSGNEFDADFTINLNQDFISVHPYAYASYCGFYINGDVMYVQGY